ncbi:hypothetical protein B0H11DRAFT_177837 [Mycena galericulata]|nr:hypothetical protein B0H11DRAFT_177837 [Mycena galericulata]
MAMESDCVSFQNPLASSNVSDSSQLSTPELTPPSSCASSTDGSEDSFFSALSSNESVALHPTVGLRTQGPIVDSPVSLSGLRVDFPSKTPGVDNHRPSPLPLHDPTVVSFSPISRRPRKLRKSRPFLPKLSLDSNLSSIPGSSHSPSLPTPLNRHQRPLLTSPIIPRRTKTPEPTSLKRSRRSSLPTIPSATFYPATKWNSDEHDEESIQNSRAVRFLTPLGPNPKPLHAPRSPHPDTLTRHASTHALVSLAWTGQIPSSIGTSHFALSSVGSTFGLSTPGSGSLASLGSASRSTWSEEDEDTFENSPPISARPRILPQHSSPPGRSRRWSLAMAITNDETTDEMFMDEVEKMRAMGKFWESRKSPGAPASPRSPVGAGTRLPTNPASPPQLKHALPCLSDPLLSATWQTARRALLICRELIRTERNYLASLFALISNETATPAPALMLTYMPALVQVSEDLLLRMESNPSAQGVAEAFLEGESRLEAAFVAWCGVAGGFFAEVDGQAMRDRAASTGVLRETDSPITMPLKRRVTTWVQGRRNSLVKSRESLASLPSAKHNQRLRAGRSLPSVRDLAILPSQRCVRYPLLFKDLLAHIPSSSPSHVFVERAMRASIVIAQKSDRAQGNAAFLQQPV